MTEQNGTALFAVDVEETAFVTYHRVANTIVDGVLNPMTKRDHARSLRDFLDWWYKTGEHPISGEMCESYVAYMGNVLSYAPTNTNPRLGVVKKLAAKLVKFHGLAALACADADKVRVHEVCKSQALDVAAVKGLPSRGHRVGVWLTPAQASALLAAPDIGTLKGLRDKAILGLLLGTGVRRAELASLTFAHLRLVPTEKGAERASRWMIVDLVGKRAKVRSIPLADWSKALVDDWAQAAGISSGYLFRPVNRGGHLAPRGPLSVAPRDRLGPTAIYDVVKHYSKILHEDDPNFPTISTHDTRRTYAKCAYRGGSPPDQLRFALGHATAAGTERYLGIDQAIGDGPDKYLGYDA